MLKIDWLPSDLDWFIFEVTGLLIDGAIDREWMKTSWTDGFDTTIDY